MRRHRLVGAVLVGALASTSGCAWLIGEGELPQPEQPVRLGVPVLPLAGGLAGTATFLGVGDRTVTATNWFGRIGRVVNAYGEDTFVFELHATNTLMEAVVLEPSKATLSYGAETVHARSLDDYRRRWPTWAVTTPDEGHDQQAAYQAVLNTLLLDRQLAPGETTSGRLAFPKRAVTEGLTLALPYIVGRQRRSLSLWWTR
jgi:hypothetical protein